MHCEPLTLLLCCVSPLHCVCQWATVAQLASGASCACEVVLAGRTQHVCRMGEVRRAQHTHMQAWEAKVPGA